MMIFCGLVALLISVIYFGGGRADLKGKEWKLAGDAAYLYAMVGLLFP